MKDKELIWISYDLGIDGDYNGLYSWLDSHKARECGDSIAAITNYDYKTDVAKELIEDLKGKVELRKTDRIYLVFKSDGKIKGKFIHGGRKRSPWEGYAISYEEEAEDE